MATLRHPIFANNGGRVQLENLFSGSSFSFDTDFTAPSWLTLNSDNELVIAANAVSEVTPILIRLDLGRCFYLVVSPNTAPTVRADANELAMLANSSFDLFLIVENADEITFRSGQTPLAGSSLTDGVFSIATTGGTAHFTATNTNGSTHFAIKINVVPLSEESVVSETLRYRVEIAGIDVSSDLVGTPTISETLDTVILDEYRVNNTTIVLSDNGGKYNSGIVGNFWDTNSLNPDGYQERIQIFKEYYDGSDWNSYLRFSGSITQAITSIGDVSVSLTCVDISYLLRKQYLSGLGVLEKWEVLDTESTSADRIFEYTPDDSLFPIQPDTAEAWNDQTELALQTSVLPSEGSPPAANAAQITPDALKTFGSLDTDPLLQFKTAPLRKTVPYLMRQIALSAGVYQVDVDVDAIELENLYILNRGSISFDVEKSRITRLPVDWVYDETNQRVLVLLSTSHKGISDLIVEYDLELDIYRVLHTFEADQQVYRIARLNATTYYILATDKTNLGHTTGGYIYEYNTSTSTLTERVSPTDTHSPRVGVRYYNHSIGVQTLADKGSFKCVGSDLYYRSGVGVARLTSNGTTESLITDTGANSTSFAFDVTENGDIYLITFRTSTLSDVTVARPSIASNTRRSQTILNNLSSFDDPIRLEIPAKGSYPSRTVLNTGSFTLWINGSVAAGLSSSSTFPHNLGNYNSITSVEYQTSGITFSGDFNIPIVAKVSESIPAANTLKIQRRRSDGTIETLLSETASNAIRAYAVQEALVHGDNLYLLMQQHTSDNLNTSQTSRLLKYDLTASPATRQILRTWTLAQDGGVHLFMHKGMPHFMYNLPLSTGVQILADPLGGINRIESDGTLTSLDNLWYEDSDQAWNLSVARPLSIGDDIHTIMGYGNLRQSFSFSPTVVDPRQKDNMQYLTRTKDLRYVISGEGFSGSIYANLVSLAKLLNATLSFESDVILIRHRRAITAEADGATGTGTADIDFDSQSRTLPTSGYLRIGNEFIKYTGISSSAFTGITRGVLGTTIADHADNSKITYMRSVFNKDDLLDNLTTQPDITNIYNVVRNSSGSIELRDDDSIARYGERVYTLDLEHLTDHDLAWQENILQQYLDNLKDLKHLVDITLQRTARISLGEIIGIKYAGLIYVMQIISITDGAYIDIQGKTI